MQIQLREGSLWRRSWDVRASTAANGEGGNVDKYSQVLWKDDVAQREEKISWASRHNRTAHAENKQWFRDVSCDLMRRRCPPPVENEVGFHQR